MDDVTHLDTYPGVRVWRLAPALIQRSVYETGGGTLQALRIHFVPVFVPSMLE